MIKRGWIRLLEFFAKVTGYELQKHGPETAFLGFDIPIQDIKCIPGVSLMSVRVLTEGGESCQHCYHEVQSLNSHKNNLKLKLDAKHRDLVCCKCTHKMCVTQWRGYDRTGPKQQMGNHKGYSC